MENETYTGPDTAAIKKKIAHLMDRAGRTEQEQTAAVALAMKLAIKYNLDIAKCADWKPGTYSKVYINVGRLVWRRTLLATICEYCFCKSFYQPAEGVNFIIGEEHNRELVEAMTRTLIAHLEPMAQRAFIQHGRGKAHAKHWKDQFFAGANSAIASRLHRLQIQQTEYKKDLPESYFETINVPGAQPESEVTITDSDIPDYRALMVIKNNALVAACDRIVGPTRNARKKVFKWDTDAHQHGYKVGQAAPLTDRIQIEGAK